MSDSPKSYTVVSPLRLNGRLHPVGATLTVSLDNLQGAMHCVKESASENQAAEAEAKAEAQAEKKEKAAAAKSK